MMSFIKRMFQHKNPLISVIIANYNNEKYLKECIDSVLNQTYKNIELVICDDSSTDSSREILDKYLMNYKNINILYSKKNVGISRTRHKAILASSGKYITTLDSDDYYINNDKLNKEMELVTNYEKQGKKTIAFSNVDVVNAEGKKISNYQGNRVKEGKVLDSILSRDCMIPRDFLFLKKSYFEIGGFDLGINLFEDWDLKIRLAEKYEFYYTEITGIAYRRKGHGLSYTSNENITNAIKRVFEKNIDLITNKHDKKSCINKMEKVIFNIQNRP